MWDAALGLLALLVGGVLLYRAVQSLGQTSVFVIQWGLVIVMITIAAVVVLRVGVEPIVTKQSSAAPCPCLSSTSKPSANTPPTPSSPLAVHAGSAIRTGLERVTGWLSSWTSGPGPAFENARSSSPPSSAEFDREL